jgi:hypothetical protein
MFKTCIKRLDLGVSANFVEVVGVVNVVLIVAETFFSFVVAVIVKVVSVKQDRSKVASRDFLGRNFQEFLKIHS